MSQQSKNEPDFEPGCMFFVGLASLAVGVYLLAGAGWAWVSFGGTMTALGLLFAWALVKRDAELSKPGTLDEVMRNQREAREARERAGKPGEP